VGFDSQSTVEAVGGAVPLFDAVMAAAAAAASFIDIDPSDAARPEPPDNGIAEGPALTSGRVERVFRSAD
jgi:hypothetical protein